MLYLSVTAGLKLVQYLPWIFLAGPVSAAPLQDTSLSILPLPLDSNTSTIPLRVLPLGNSITFGFASTDGNGYRQDLLTMLNSNGTNTTYIGSLRAGNMTNNENEGHPGAVITEIAQFAKPSLLKRPNVILMMAGTNDIASNQSTPTAPARLGALIDECISACPDALILVAQLTPAAGNDTMSRIETFNDAVPGVVKERTERGAKAIVVDMLAFVTEEDLKDGLHPNDRGYNQMAKAWFAGLQEARRKGWISEPVTIGGEL